MTKFHDREPILELSEVSKCFGKAEALNGISFDINLGEVVGLIGPNGAGKTTLIKCLAGLVKPTSGQIAKRECIDLQSRGAIRDLAFVYEVDALPLDMTVRKFLLAEAYAIGQSWKRVDGTLNKFIPSQNKNRRIGELSMGNKRKVALAAALLVDCNILVLDEPTNGLDFDGINTVRDIIRAQKCKGGSVVFSSHTISEVEKIADRIIVMSEGSIIFCGEGKMLQEEMGGRSLEEAYGFAICSHRGS